MLKNMQYGWEIFTLSPAAYITVDFKKVISDPAVSRLFHFGRKRMFEEKNEAIGMASKYNNSLRLLRESSSSTSSYTVIGPYLLTLRKKVSYTRES